MVTGADGRDSNVEPRVLVASTLCQGGPRGGTITRKLLGTEGAWGSGCSPVGTEHKDLEGGWALSSALIATPTTPVPTVR